jgi:hypothetical protein
MLNGVGLVADKSSLAKYAKVKVAARTNVSLIGRRLLRATWWPDDGADAGQHSDDRASHM